jgi:DNA (cytosine-5)-methyltransferase 1
MITFNAADLFCGAGGTSTGLLQAAEDLNIKVELLAINHWEIAIATHGLNHPDVSHYNSDLSQIDPRKVIPSGKLRLLVASPECTHFSNARGGRPTNNQGRASIKYILRWVGALDVQDVLIENVPEFKTWGPLHRKHIKGCRHVDGTCRSKKCIYGKPIKSRKGEYFHRFIRKMEANGYQVKWMVLNAADYGDATTRKRLFIIARKGLAASFPEPTHGRQQQDLFRHLQAWRAAREIIDWNMKGTSIFTRKTPLSENTMRRIMAGLVKFGGKAFVIGQQSQAAPRDVDEPIPTIAGAGAISFVEPFILPQFSSGSPHSVDDPLSTITSTSRGIALIEPFLVEYHSGKDSDRRTKSIDEPLPTQTTFNHFGLVEPFIIPFFGERDGQHPRSHSLNEPLPTITSHGAGGLVEPFLVEYYGTGAASSVDEPLKTQTGKDRFALVEPLLVKGDDGKVYSLDILFRMLHPHELAGAMSFPKDYQFQGNREQIVKQIGNAVPVETARALCKHLLGTRLA